MKYNYAKAKRFFLSHKAETLGQAAEMAGIKHKSLRMRAAKEKWVKLRKDRDKEAEALASMEAVKMAETDLVEINTRHMKQGKVMQQLAAQALQKYIDKKGELTPHEAAYMMKIGVLLERDAAGLNSKDAEIISQTEKYVIVVPAEMGSEQWQKQVKRHLQSAEKK